MKDQWMLNQRQFTIQSKRVDLVRKILICIPNRVIDMAAPTFKN